jgi:hypothetical protein
MAKKQGRASRVFYWPVADRSEHLLKLLPFVGGSNMPEWAKRDVESLLIDLAFDIRPTSGGRPPTPQQVQRRIAHCMAWLKERHPDLRQKQRDAIVCDMLNIKPRALTTVEAAHHHTASTSLAQWTKTPEGESFAKAMDAEAWKERAKLTRRRDS